MNRTSRMNALTIVVFNYFTNVISHDMQKNRLPGQTN